MVKVTHDSRGTFATAYGAFAGEHAGHEIPSFISKTADNTTPVKELSHRPSSAVLRSYAVPDIAGCDNNSGIYGGLPESF